MDVVAVYLRADPDTLAGARPARRRPPRPLVGHDPLAALRGMFRDRDATYRALADIEVQVDGRTHEEIAALVLAAVRGAGARAAACVGRGALLVARVVDQQVGRAASAVARPAARSATATR